MAVEPAIKRFAALDRTEVAQRLRDDTQRMLDKALEHPDLVELISLLARARDEAERVVRETLNSH